MWPVVHSGDACTLQPIQAVTAVQSNMLAKDASETDVGDIVFCFAQPRHQYYAHIVLRKQPDMHSKEMKFWIGNMKGHCNGCVYRKHVSGILTRVEWWDKATLSYMERPLSRELVKRNVDLRWDHGGNQR